MQGHLAYRGRLSDSVGCNPSTREKDSERRQIGAKIFLWQARESALRQSVLPVVQKITLPALIESSTATWSDSATLYRWHPAAVVFQAFFRRQDTTDTTQIAQFLEVALSN
jgi:hypothetical protein